MESTAADRCGAQAFRLGKDTTKPVLLICIGEYIPGAGQSTVVESEILHLMHRYDITLIAPRILREIPREIRSEVISVRNPLGLWKLVRLFRSADIIHLHDSLVYMMVGVLVRNSRCIVTSHGVAPPKIRTGIWQKAKGYLTQAIYPLLYRRVRVVVGISGFVAKWSELRGVKRLNIIPNGGPPVLKEEAFRPLDKRLVYVGEVSHRKGIDLLFSGLRGCPSDVSLDVIGKGNLKWALSLARRSGISERIRFHGSLSDNERDELVGIAMAIVSMSRWEGFGLPVLEGFASGRPAIVLGGSAMEEIVRVARGGVVVDDAAGLASAILEVWNEWDELSRNARGAVAVMGWAQTWDAYDELFRISYE